MVTATACPSSTGAGAGDWKDIETRVEQFRSTPAATTASDEERRLAYVAFTRARSDMLLTAPVWADGNDAAR